jgi:hypothetical protein
MTATPILTEALAIAARGVPVFPCRLDRAPACANGYKDASTHPGVIRRMFSRPFALMVATPTGELTGFDIVDVDYKHRGDLWESENLHRLPPTRIHGTQTGGKHYLFQHHPGMKNSVGHVGLGVDVRGDGGYAILPPSPGYSVLLQAKLAPWPDWLAKAAAKIRCVPPSAAQERPSSKERAEDQAYQKRLNGYIAARLRVLAAAPDGKKHHTLLRVARSLGTIAADAGLSDDAAIQYMMAALEGRDVKDELAAVQTARDGLEFGRKRPSPLDERPYAEVRP